MTQRISIIGTTDTVTYPTWRDDELQAVEKEFLAAGVITGMATSQRGAGANMSVDVSAGLCLTEITNANLTPSKTYKVYHDSDAVVNVAITTSDPTDPRIDIIVAKVDDSTDPDAGAGNIASIIAVAGTPAASPAVPATPADCTLLAKVAVAAGATSITNANITDMRTYASLRTDRLTDVTRQGMGNSVAAGSGTNTVTASYTPTITALTDRMLLWVVPANDNTAAATFSPDGLSAKSIKKFGSTALDASDMRAKVAALLQYNLADDNWKLLNPQGSSSGSKTISLVPDAGNPTIVFGCAAAATYSPGAIAFDAFTTGAPSASATHTIAHTCTGSNRLLFVNFQVDDATDIVTGVTYGGVAMTRVGALLNKPTGASESVYRYRLIAPASGANNVVISLSASKAIRYSFTSYTGCNQSFQPSTSTTGSIDSNTAFSLTSAEITGNDWVVGFFRNGVGNYTAGANTTLRGGPNAYQVADSNAAGIYTLNVTSSSANHAGIITAISPASQNMARVFDFDQSAFEMAEWQFTLPGNYSSGTITAKLHWASTAASGDVVWKVQATTLVDNESLAAYGTAVSVTDSCNGAGKVNVTAASSAITILGTPVAGSLCWLRVARDAAHASDTLAADARLIAIEISYN